MANHYHKGEFTGAPAMEAGHLLNEIQDFLDRCSKPAVVEVGDEPVPLLPGQHLWEVRNGGLFFSAWPGSRGINRRITAIEARKPGLLVCTIQRFGGMEGRLNVLDLAHPRAAGRLVSGERQTFSEAFRRLLSRQLPAWKLRSLSTGMSLQQSLSPKFPRAVLEQGNRRIAAAACPSLEDESQFLSFALLWHDHVSGTPQNRSRTPLVLFLPDGGGNTTALRLKWLRLPVRLFRFNEHGSAGEIDPLDLGNMDTHIAPRNNESALPPAFLKDLVERYGLELNPDAESGCSLSCNGVEFAHFRGEVAYCGLDRVNRRTPASIAELEALAGSLSSIRRADSAHCDHPLYYSEPESWLAASVRRDPGVIDAGLEGQPVLPQVITFAAADRNIIDLLSVTRQGRATVIELKAGEDIHLPLQALDYWMRVEWHARAGDLDPLFPGVRIQQQPPKLLLVAPAVAFHASNEVILSYFDPQIETERVGLNLEWQQGLKIAFRLSGSEKPQSQRRWQ